MEYGKAQTGREDGNRKAQVGRAFVGRVSQRGLSNYPHSSGRDQGQDLVVRVGMGECLYFEDYLNCISVCQS